MTSAFSVLNVDFVELSKELGLTDTLKASDIDFVNLTESYDASDSSGKAITAAFKANSNSNAYNYGFILYTNATSYIDPRIIETSVNKYLKFFDLTMGLVTTLSNYGSANYTFTNTTGSYIIGGAGGDIKTRPLLQNNGGCGQAVMNCITDVYTNHGWTSVFVFVETAFLPQTAAAFAAACAIKNCLK